MTATITSLAGAIGQLLTRNDSDAEQLADVASVINVITEAIRAPEARERMEWLLADLRYFAEQRSQSEREAAEEHARLMRTSGRYRSAVLEGRD